MKDMNNTIGICGLGLIGGSLAKAYKMAGFTVYGYDKDKVTMDLAKLSEAIDDVLEPEKFAQCDCIFIAITPKAAAAWLEENAKHMNPDSLVIDCCGTKRYICERGFALAKEYGFTYAGGHPMAGLQYGGFKNSRYDLYEGSVFALVPETCTDISYLQMIRDMLTPAGFGKVVITTAESHDETIAFTSQMAHVVSNAFIKSKTALKKDTEISGGSYRDFTRVAYLDAKMWTELFLENGDNLSFELKTLIDELEKYKEAIDEKDSQRLFDLLIEGRERKSEVERRCNLKC